LKDIPIDEDIYITRTGNRVLGWNVSVFKYNYSNYPHRDLEISLVDT
jgi:hypothetical protein